MEPKEPTQTTETDTKRPAYEAPRIVEVAEFETLALQCARETVAACRPGPAFNS